MSDGGEAMHGDDARHGGDAMRGDDARHGGDAVHGGDARDGGDARGARGSGSAVPGNRFDLLDGRWPAQPPTVSVVVVHFAQPVALRRTLDALAVQTHPSARLQIIVADDGSPTPPALPAGVRLVRQADRGARPGLARNLGAAQAEGEVLCFLDADTTPEPDFVRALTRLPSLAGEAVTVARRRHADLGSDGDLAHARERELPEPAWLRAGYAATRNLLDADERSYRYVISAVLATGRAFFEEVGGFAAFDAYGGEDWEWAHRAWRAGALLAHVPEAVAWHDGPDWAGRDDDPTRRRQKNAETRRLAALVGVPGSRGRGLRPRRPETVVTLRAGADRAQGFLCADAILAALPDAVLLLEDEALRAEIGHDDRVRPLRDAAEPALAWPALELEVHRPVEVDPDGLRALCAEVRREAHARLVLADAAGPLLTLSDVRARRRARRTHDAARLEGTVRDAGPHLAALGPEPDLEAWTGGWANSRLPGP